MWAQFINIMLGIWLMAAPTILGYVGPARTNHRIVGPLAVSCAVIALWEVTRPVRWGNLVLGLWLVVAPWMLTDAWAASLNSTLVGLLLTAFALVRGTAGPQRFGGGWSALWRTTQLPWEHRGGGHA
jgi:SPW repeat